MTDAPRTGAVKQRGIARNAFDNIWPPFVFGAGVITVWYCISYIVLSEKRRFLLRPPHLVLQNGFFKWPVFSEMLGALWNSTKVAGIGLALAIIIGLALAVIMSQAKMLERAMFPYLVIVQAIPILALTPLIVFWFGSGQTARIIVCIIISVFPLIVNTLFGLQSAERGMHDLFTLHHASRVTRLRRLMFPAALPAIFAGLRISAGLSVIGAIVGDFFFGQGEVGIGQLIRRYANRLQGEELITAVILSSLLGVSVFLLFTWLQNRAIGRWYDSSSGGNAA
jgi:NitT/TauT family transport system permease protein